MQLIVNIPDNRLAFFMELVNSLGFAEVEKSDILTTSQVQLVEAARKKAKENPDELIEWEAALQQIDWDAR